ncbi:MAG: hypothetical protein KA956_07495 [Pyrinomonadaceae bacterium]|nr:hypothetical protein [Acidobacteriota bacterium]MBP7376305.1 hypothetical protein [Pyrinomonadaceae bacterium]
MIKANTVFLIAMAFVAVISIDSMGQTVIKGDSYSPPMVYDEKKSLDKLAENLLDNPEATGYIIVYRSRTSPPLETTANIARIQKYMLDTHRLDSKRITVVDGGRKQEPRTQAYLVPKGADVPKPTPTDFPANDPISSKVNEYSPSNEEVEMANLDDFNLRIQNDPDAVGHIIAYGGRKGRPGEARAIIKRASNYLIKIRRADAKRLMFVDGGLREKASVELWVVPLGADTPKPTPTVRVVKKPNTK